jgi:hypothetical protein
MDAVTLHTLTRMITAINVAYGMLSATCSWYQAILVMCTAGTRATGLFALFNHGASWCRRIRSPCGRTGLVYHDGLAWFVVGVGRIGAIIYDGFTCPMRATHGSYNNALLWVDIFIFLGLIIPLAVPFGWLGITLAPQPPAILSSGGPMLGYHCRSPLVCACCTPM